MAYTSESTVVDFDAVAAGEAVREVVAGDLFALVEFDDRTFNPVFVAEGTMALYDDEDHMHEHFGRIHDYVHLDFTEQDLFTTELLPTEDRVHYIATRLDGLKLVRYYRGADGLFLSLEPTEPVEPVVAAVEDAIGTQQA